MADHGVQRPTPGRPLTRRQKDINIAINREGIAKSIAASDAAAAPRQSAASALASRGDVIDSAVADSQRLKTNQSTDATN